MRLLHLPAQEYRRERWRNERGWTREIHRQPEGAGDWLWRASIAEIDQDAPFSAFAGCDLLPLTEGSLAVDILVPRDTLAVLPPGR